MAGNAGAGKSTLALKLGKKLGYPVHHLDAIVWRPGWRKAPATERELLEQELPSQRSWIIDGVSKGVREAADLVIVLGTLRPTCLYRAAKINSRYLLRSRPGLPDNCPEILIVPHLFNIIMRYPESIRSKILGESQSSKKYRWVTSNHEIDVLVQSITGGI